MNTILVEAIKERVRAGQSEADIRAEVLAAGHSAEVFTEAWNQAHAAELSPIPVTFDYRQVFKESWSLALSAWVNLVKAITTLGFMLLLGGTALMATFWLWQGGHILQAVSVTVLAGLMLLFLVSLPMLALLRSLLKRQEGHSYFQHLKLSLPLIIPFMVVGLYSGILTQVGYLFFVLPGIFMTVLLAVSVPVLVDSGERGLSALVVSSRLVYGQFFKVLWAMIFIVAVFMLLMTVSGALIGLAVWLEPWLLLIMVPLSVVVFVFGLFWQQCYLVVLYEKLKIATVGAVLPGGDKPWRLVYLVVVSIVIAILTILIFLFSFAMTTLLKNQPDMFTTSVTSGEMMRDIARKQALQSVAVVAIMDYQINNESDVCAGLTLPPDTTCVSDETGFALETKLSEGYFCTDSSEAKVTDKRSQLVGVSCGVAAEE